MRRARVLSVALLLLVGACGTPAPPTSRRVIAHESAADSAGTMLLVDVCLNYSPLGTDDYFVIANARQGADALAAAARQFFDAGNDVRIRTQLVPFVCGALHDTGNAPKRVAPNVDGEVRVQPQPLWVAPDVAADPEYAAALTVLSSHLFQSSLVPAGTAAAAVPQAVRDAAAVVAGRSGRSSLIYVGVTGHSLSTGKAAAMGAARIATGVALSLAVGPVFTSGGASYGVVFVPGGPVDKRQMVAALFDLRQATVIRSNVIHGGGDPMDATVLASREAVQLLLRDVAFAPTGR